MKTIKLTEKQFYVLYNTFTLGSFYVLGPSNIRAMLKRIHKKLKSDL